MAESNQTKQTATITYMSPRPVNIGDVFYRVEYGEWAHFTAPCRVCGGKKEITVNGITFKCPMCDEETEVLKVAKYVVRRYRVYAVCDEVQTNEWKASTSHFVTFRLYRKVGHGNVDWYTQPRYGGNFDLHAQEFATRLNRKYDPSNPARVQDDALFDDYKLACEYADAANAAEMQRVADYNAEHGTSHVAVFKVENDPKAN